MEARETAIGTTPTGTTPEETTATETTVVEITAVEVVTVEKGMGKATGKEIEMTMGIIIIVLLAGMILLAVVDMMRMRMAIMVVVITGRVDLAKGMTVGVRIETRREITDMAEIMATITIGIIAEAAMAITETITTTIEEEAVGEITTVGYGMSFCTLLGTTLYQTVFEEDFYSESCESANEMHLIVILQDESI
jgi:hypothetical protein